MSHSSSIEEFLAQARSEGTFHSQGEFSLDPIRAREMLSRYQLPDNDYYVLKLVQFAVAAGADEIRFSNTNRSLQATIVGWQLDFFDTAKVIASLIDNPLEQEGPLRHLSVAFQAAMAQNPQRLEWSVWNAYQQEKISFDGGGAKFEKLVTPPFAQRTGSRYVAGYVFALGRGTAPSSPTTGWLARLSQGLATRVAAIQTVATLHNLISSKCRFSPIKVILDGREVNRPLDFFDSDYGAKHRLIVLDGSRNRIGLPAASKLQNAVVLEQLDSQHLCPAALEQQTSAAAHCFTPQESLSGRLEQALLGMPHKQMAVHCGVLIFEAPHWFPLLMSSAGLDLDLSEQKLVENQSYRDRLNDLRQLLEQAPASNSSAYPVGAIAGQIRPLRPLPTSEELSHLSTMEVDPNSGMISLCAKDCPQGAYLSFGGSERAILTSPQRIWPAKPPKEVSLWSRWLQGAIQTVTCHDFYKFTAADLPGPWFALAHESQISEGVVADFWPDGQLRELYYSRQGSQVGWRLSLEENRPQGSTHHIQGGDCEEYHPGQNQTWGEWVQLRIECVYRDAQS